VQHLDSPKLDCPILLAEPEPGGPAARTLEDQLAHRGLGVISAQSRDDLLSMLAWSADAGGAGTGGFGLGGSGSLDFGLRDFGIGAALLDWELCGSEPELHIVLDGLDALPGRPPVVLLSERADEQAVSVRVARRIEGYFWLRADSPRYVARQVEQLVRNRASRPAPQFTEAATGDAGPQPGVAVPVDHLGQPGHAEEFRGWMTQRQDVPRWPSSCSMIMR
jgi:hypothetical protein